MLVKRERIYLMFISFLVEFSITINVINKKIRNMPMQLISIKFENIQKSQRSVWRVRQWGWAGGLDFEAVDEQEESKKKKKKSTGKNKLVKSGPEVIKIRSY